MSSLQSNLAVLMVAAAYAVVPYFLLKNDYTYLNMVFALYILMALSDAARKAAGMDK